MIFDLPESVYCYAFSLRKQRLLRHFIPHVKVKSLSRSQSLSSSATVLIWGAEPAASHWPSSTRIIRVEDGFLRSVGLGADLVRPVSWVFDSRGIYFDASSASDLEWLLENASVDNGLLERADSLVKKVIELGFYLGIGGVVTYKNAGLAKIVEETSLEHLVLETDAPYLSPVPFRGKRNESSYIPLIGEALSNVLEIPTESIAQITTKNAIEIFQL